MAKANIDKFIKHKKLVSDSIKINEIPESEAYAIDVSLVSWALRNISTKQLKQLIKLEKK